MAEKFNPKGLANFKELLMSDVIQPEAMITLLECKGIIGTPGRDQKGEGATLNKADG